MRYTIPVVTQKSNTRVDKCGAAFGVIGDHAFDNHKTIQMSFVEATSYREDIILHYVVLIQTFKRCIIVICLGKRFV